MEHWGIPSWGAKQETRLNEINKREELEDKIKLHRERANATSRGV